MSKINRRVTTKDSFLLCQCGCGERVKKKNNKYISGHQNRGRKGQVAWNRGLKVDSLKWHKEDCTCSFCKAKRKEYVGENHPMYNKHHTKETKEKLRDKRVLQISSGMKDKHHTKESRIQMSLSKGCNGILKEKVSIPCKCGCGQMTNPGSEYIFSHQRIGCKHSEESRFKQSEAKIGNIPWNKNGHWNEAQKEKLPIKRKETASNPEWIKNQSIKGKELWNNPEHVHKIMAAQAIRPNKPETVILNLLNENYPNEWKYTGDFSFMVDGKSPDFVNKDNNKIIELFGDYWHKGQNPQDRIDIFKPFNYDTLIIWEHELKDIDKVKSKIDNFARK